MGWDSAGSNTNLLDLQGESTNKTFARRIGDQTCLIGASGSRRLTELIEHHVVFPDLPTATTSEAMMRYLIVDVIPKFRLALKEGGVMTTKDGVESAPGMILVGVCGRLYTIEGDLSVRSHDDSFAAVGSGATEARGVCFGVNKLNVEVDPETLIRTALEAAERWTPSVRGPFQVIHS